MFYDDFKLGYLNSIKIRISTKTLISFHRYHLQVVKKYGHFPHRNEIMGRINTPEEVKFLEDKTFRFDLPLVYGDDGSVKFVQTEEYNHRQKLMEDMLDKGE